ncbi:hypothetical protein ACN9JG_21440 (plasmid) [Cereibacter azotoformans]|uniref:Uncharacterized protein n=1 Tax=Cereibacter azotoformans TaxID=43057 RepID=A0A2T5JSR6_9RHOB|nr:hypothetical protein [Cereibacter azotoformans]PTR12044.1 hypothetical protein C8J28_1253 [Cereibacter azotoformans]
MPIHLLSAPSACLVAVVLLAIGLRRRDFIAALPPGDPLRAYHDATRTRDMRDGRKLTLILMAYLVFVLGLAAAGLGQTPTGAAHGILGLALLFSGSLALLVIRCGANQPGRGMIMLPPALLLLFGLTYPMLA